MTREEAIDIIKAERECVYRQGRTGECCRDDMGCCACDLVQEDTNIMKAYDMAIEALKERPQWIPCAERLPEEYHTYLVTKLDPNPSKSTFTTLAYFYTEETGWDIDDVIAWMPFPKPYQKEGERNEID